MTCSVIGCENPCVGRAIDAMRRDLAAAREQLAAKDAEIAYDGAASARYVARQAIIQHDLRARAEAAESRVLAVERERDAKVKAAEVLSNIYFDIAEEVVGTDEVRRQREERLARKHSAAAPACSCSPGELDAECGRHGKGKG